MARKICAKCQRDMDDTNFYTYKNGDKHKLCKACLTMHIDNFNPDTFLYILQEMDVPYIPEEWNILRDRAYAKNPQKMNGQSVIGKYLSKMKLKQFKQYGWADSVRLQEQRQKRLNQQAEELAAHQQLLKQQFEKGQISEQQYRTLTSTEFQKQHEYIMPSLSTNPFDDPVGKDNAFKEEDFISEDDLPNYASEISLEEKQQMALKWGRTYKIRDWIYLQKKYNEMMNSFDIQDADSKNTLIFICKTLLKMDQAIDCGDVDGYQKLSRVYDSLRKSMHVTAAQNKEDKKDFIDSVGQLVAYCEKNGGAIPRYQIKAPLDIIDKVIQDMKDYTKNLIYQDSSLGRQIEDYIKQARAAADRKRDREEAKRLGLEVPELTDEDILKFKQFIKAEKQKDGEENVSSVDSE